MCLSFVSITVYVIKSLTVHDVPSAHPYLPISCDHPPYSKNRPLKSPSEYLFHCKLIPLPSDSMYLLIPCYNVLLTHTRFRDYVLTYTVYVPFCSSVTPTSPSFLSHRTRKARQNCFMTFHGRLGHRRKTKSLSWRNDIIGIHRLPRFVEIHQGKNIPVNKVNNPEKEILD